MLLVVGFFGIMLLTFGVVIVVTNPSSSDKVIQQRLAIIAAQKAGAGQATLEASQLLRKQETGNFGWLEHLLEQYASLKKVREYISQSGLKTTISSILVQSVICGAVGYLGAMMLCPILAVEIAAPAVLVVLPMGRVWLARSRRVRAFDNALPQAIDMMARALRAGHSTASALELMTQGAPEPACSEFSEVFRQQNFGMPLRDALMQMLERVPSQDLRVVSTAIIVQRETGGNLVEILDRTVFIIRERQRIKGEIRIQTAQGRLTGWILSALPIIMLALINFVDPGYSKILFTDPTGHMLIWIGLGLIVLGSFFINKIVNSIEV